MYEREGLLRPARTEGNTRLYDSDTIERLEIILTLTRHLGVNLAGVEVILHMKQRMERMHGDVQKMLEVLQPRAERPPARRGHGRPGQDPRAAATRRSAAGSAVPTGAEPGPLPETRGAPPPGASSRIEFPVP